MNRRNSRREATLTVLAAFGVLTACAQDTPARSEGTAPGWQETAGYSFTVESRCGERGFLGTYRVGVENGRVRQLKPLDEAARVSAAGRQDAPTLAGIVQEYEQARADGAHRAEAEFDNENGHPVSVSIDPDRNAVDEESCYTITDYTG